MRIIGNVTAWILGVGLLGVSKAIDDHHQHEPWHSNAGKGKLMVEWVKRGWDVIMQIRFTNEGKGGEVD